MPRSLHHLFDLAFHRARSQGVVHYQQVRDAWGGVRAVRGVMLSTFGLNNGLGQTAEGAGDKKLWTPDS